MRLVIVFLVITLMASLCPVESKVNIPRRAGQKPGGGHAVYPDQDYSEEDDDEDGDDTGRT